LGNKAAYVPEQLPLELHLSSNYSVLKQDIT